MDASPRRRDLRDWTVDIGLFIAALLATFGITVLRLDAGVLDPAWLFPFDQFAGAAACAAVWLRRRWPVGLALILALLSAVFELVAGAALVALFTVAIHRGPRVTAGVFGLGMASGVVFMLLRPEPDVSPVFFLSFAAIVQGAAVGWGLFVKHRRELLASLRERAERAESEAQLRAAWAQSRARDAIAREMHDVLGHRLSLLSVHAGALEFRPDAAPDDVARAAGVIRESAHQALEELRRVIGVLRTREGELPQPTFGEIPALVEESARAGMRVDCDESVDGGIGADVGRAAYRIVQEGLTNARKHAPQAAVRIRLWSAAGRLHISVDNDPAVAAGPRSRDGQGLIGLAERVKTLDGELSHGPTPEGGWRLTARLPLRTGQASV